MQMAISQASATGVQAPSGGKAAKGADGQAFGQALSQTITGVSGNAGQADQASAGNTSAATSALTNLIGAGVTTADLLAAIEALMKQVEELSGEDVETNVTEADLNTAIAELDNLLAYLGAVPAMQPMLDQTMVQPDLSLQGDAAEAAAFAQATVVKADLLKAQAAAVIENLTVQMQTGVKLDQSGENFAAMKSALEGALADLRSFLQGSKGSSAGIEQNAMIGKQLQAVKQVLEGAAIPSADLTEAEAQLTDLVRSMTSQSAASSHLQRLGNQLLHAGLISLVPTQDEAGAELTVEPVTLPTAVLQQAVGSQEVQRQQPVKPTLVHAVPVQQFAETMESLVVKQLQVSSANGISEARISLYPERLGQVDVRITVHNGQLTAMFLTDTASARDMLENQMTQLRSALQAQGLQVDKLEVSQNQNADQANLFHDRGGSSNRDQQATKRNKSKDDSSFDRVQLDAEQEELAIEQAVDRTLGFGRGVNARA
ncbi:flagellar hook-length control protein FliK [Paenibacillus mendelii]|uniref:Flagellar hook-length control protein FliK n=1 Tax=Paenibacillus mendelii TaxID=206163 RepID=A0ABV6JGL5_9BACL|nr:flagellar hook-length control protein FliK [Paenibacillus mendelii]MCQ6557916.1 flagellar hook-length control protein FliK [Paenibacillus mendelii]